MKKEPRGGPAPAVGERMGEAAERWLAALSADQRARALFAFEDQRERTQWYYIPKKRNGLALRGMDRRQQRLAHQLVATGLSRAGYVTAATIMGLELTLDQFENWALSEPGRDPELYCVSLFGSPGSGEWGWRFEGHHISLNYTLSGGRLLSPTPTFFGANPAEAPLGSAVLIRPLARVEEIARELMRSFSDEQRSIALISPAAPPDIVTSNRPRVIEGALPLATTEMRGMNMTEQDRQEQAQTAQELGLTTELLERLRYRSTPRGLASARMTDSQRELLLALLREYIGRMPDEAAEGELVRLDPRRLGEIHLAWAGSLEPRRPHYYRLQGPGLLVEYDNTQNEANHIHSVWRDPDNDFGFDVLARHTAQAH